MENIPLYVKPTEQQLSRTRFPNYRQTYMRQAINPLHQTTQGISAADPGTPL